MEKIEKKKLKPLAKMELIAGLVFVIAVKLIYHWVSPGIAVLVASLLMTAFAILLIVQARRQVYWPEKPLLMVLSILYKVNTYCAMIFSMRRYPGTDAMVLFCWVLITLYMVLAYFNGKRYGEMLNAYVYFNLLSLFFIGMTW